jgi:hypothetical protein
MAALTGVPAIKRLIISLLVIGAVVCGAIYAIVNPPKPIVTPVASQAARTLAYQEKIERTGEAAQAQDQAQTERETQKHAMAPTDAAPATQPQQSAPPPQTQATAPAQSKPAAPQQSQSSDVAGLPPGGEAEPYDPNALPWEHGAPAQQGWGAEAPTPPPGAWSGEGDPGYPDDQQDARAWPGEDADPNAWPAGPQDEPQEWVQVLVSGAGMYGTASEEAPMLFAFPYGRTLRVISRYGNWVEVTDPQSATTGWMKAQYLAPVMAPRPPQEVEAWYDDEQPRRRRGWFRRHGGEGIADMIGRALGGGF